MKTNLLLCAALAAVCFHSPLPGAEDRAGAIQHIVLFGFKSDVPAAEAERLLGEFELLPARIPGILGLQWGTNSSPEGLDKGFTHGFVLTFRSRAALEAYLPHPAHRAFGDQFRPRLERLFVFDFALDRPPPPAEPGRVHHLVFFKFKAEAGAAQIEEVEREFSKLPASIPGLLRYQSGKNLDTRDLSLGMTHGFQLIFNHQFARDDYLPHPAHRAFGQRLGPVLADVLVLDFAVRPSGRHLLVTGGLEPFKVYQRGEDGKAALSFSGLASGAGDLEARLLSGRRVVEGFDWRKVGRAEGGKFEGSLAGVPAGGEYQVEIRRRDAVGNVAEVTAVENVLVGDVWLLAGQSNMEGYGNLAAVEDPSSQIHSFTMAHRWELAVEPLHWLADSRDPVHLGDRFKGLDEEGRQAQRSRLRRERKKGAGLALPFAKHLLEHTGIPIGLIPAAHGGTSMTQWDPAQKERGGESLYGSLLKQVRRAGGKVKGVLWYQGESDANPEAAGLFRERFSKLVASLREDLGNPRLPFYYVQIGRFVVDGRDAGPWKAVQEAQRIAVREIPGTAVVSAIDLSLDDAIHASTEGLKRLGVRLAKVARREFFGEERLRAGPTPAGARIEEDGAAVRVLFSNVNGRLEPAGKIAGFSVRKADGRELPLIYSAAVDPAQPHTVLLRLSGKWPEGATLWYGAGFDPFANLTDSEDLAAPAFGPLDLKEPKL